MLVYMSLHFTHCFTTNLTHTGLAENDPCFHQACLIYTEHVSHPGSFKISTTRPRLLSPYWAFLEGTSAWWSLDVCMQFSLTLGGITWSWLWGGKGSLKPMNDITGWVWATICLCLITRLQDKINSQRGYKRPCTSWLCVSQESFCTYLAHMHSKVTS